MPLSGDQIQRTQDVFEPLHGRRLIEAGRYVDGDPLIILVFADRPDQDAIDRGAGDRVRWAFSSYDEWTLCAGAEAVARSGDSDEMDVPGFNPVLGERLLGADVGSDGGLALKLSGGYQVSFVGPGGPCSQRRWTVTTPTVVTTLTGDRLQSE